MPPSRKNVRLDLAEVRRLYVGVRRKADGLEHVLEPFRRVGHVLIVSHPGSRGMREERAIPTASPAKATARGTRAPTSAGRRKRIGRGWPRYCFDAAAGVLRLDAWTAIE